MTRETQASRRFRKASFYSFIAFLALTALVAIGCVISGEFGYFEVKVLVTTSTIGAASVCFLCCGSYFNRTGKITPAGAGIAMAVVAAAMIITAAWAEIEADDYLKTTAVIGVFAIAFAHCLALLAVRLRPGHGWIQLATAVTIFGLAALISGMIIGEIEREDAGKPLAVLAILSALETLVIPILGRVARTERSQARGTLVLKAREDGNYEDERGRVYRVTQM
jgi:hypothetical protein